jgi:hypothetical protein
MTTQSVLLAKANLYEELMEHASELRTILMVVRNMLIKLANNPDNMSLERADEQIAAIEEMLPTELIECLHRYGGPPSRKHDG